MMGREENRRKRKKYIVCFTQLLEMADAQVFTVTRNRSFFYEVGGLVGFFGGSM